jgi:seryl-tRNA synthetase
MLDIKFIRENPNLVKEACRNKGVRVNINRILELDKKRRNILVVLEGFRAQKNQASREIAKTKNKEIKKRIIFQMRMVDKKSDKIQKKLKKIEEEFNNLIFQVPNIPFSDVPVGKDEKDNIIIKKQGKKPKFNFKPKDYLKIAENFDLIDIKRAAKISGTRFGFIKGELALLEFAIVNFTFENLIKEGFIPIIPPVMLKEKMARGTGYFEATDIEEAYFFPKDKLFLVGTSEQSLLTMHSNEILDELPRRYAGFSTCFRREAGSYGKDTRGIFRVHQFDKVEMFSFCHPKESKKEHRFFLALEEKLMKSLKLPYQVVQICTGDLGLPVAAKYDIETWLPSEKRFRETHSTSNCTDFQARRLNIKYRSNKGLKFVHTVNGTAFAIGRTLIAILENYQQKNGTIIVPKVLRKYIGGYKKIPWLKREKLK